MSERELTYGEAVREAIAEAMRRDRRVFLIGEGESSEVTKAY
jgi:pyruvate/2-oxoglutarate/acetoin dehydrogenase E1 component